MFTATLFTIAPNQKQLRCPPRGEWVTNYSIFTYSRILLSKKNNWFKPQHWCLWQIRWAKQAWHKVHTGHFCLIYSGTKQINGCPGLRADGWKLTAKGLEVTFKKWRQVPASWSWWQFQRCMCVSKLIRLYTYQLLLMSWEENLETQEHSHQGTRPLKMEMSTNPSGCLYCHLVCAALSPALTFVLAAPTHTQGLAQGTKLLPDAQSSKVFPSDFNNLMPWKIWHKCLFKKQIRRWSRGTNSQLQGKLLWM